MPQRKSHRRYGKAAGKRVASAMRRRKRGTRQSNDKTVATLAAMKNSRKEIEIDFLNGAVVWAMNNRSLIGGVQ